LQNIQTEIFNITVKRLTGLSLFRKSIPSWCLRDTITNVSWCRMIRSSAFDD